MQSTSTQQIRRYTSKLIENINNRIIPTFMDNKRLSPPQRNKMQEIKNAQIEVLNEVIKYIDKTIHAI
jgi:glutamate formiminotransferase